MARKIAVVGAGVGGLAAAARLGYQGYDVEVFEKLPSPGGRNSLLEDNGFKFDMGPSFVLMPEFFQEVFSYCREDLKNYLDLKPLEINYHVFYPDNSKLTVWKDNHKTKEELESIEPGSPSGYDAFLKASGETYNLVKPLLYRCFSAGKVFDPHYLPLLFKLKPFKSYWDVASQYFKSDKLRFAFTFEAMFMGVSPHQAPGFYSIITYADHVQKIFHPMGGMYQIPLALEKLAKKFRVKFNYSSEVKSIRQKNSSLVLEVNGAEDIFDAVVVNADYPYAQEQLLGRKIPDYKYSCSVYLLYLGLKTKVNGAAHHNLFFSSDLDKNLKQIFVDKENPEDPSFYVHVPTVTDPALAPAGKDICYILVPLPNLKGNKEEFRQKEIRIRSLIFKKINQKFNIDLEKLIEVEHKFYPEDFIKRYNINYGATFGLAHNLLQSAFFRPVNFDRKIKNLYYVGASTQPGGGLPVVIASSKIVADLIKGVR